MRWMLLGAMAWMLWHAQVTMDAAASACRLFVTAVLPGLFPYMVLSLMVMSRSGSGLRPGTFLLLGWCGGSPSGARLLTGCACRDRRQQVMMAVGAATMSPMFLLGTLGGWLQSARAGIVLLVSVIGGGWLTGMTAARCVKNQPPMGEGGRATSPLSFGVAVEQAARTMLVVCGTMVMMRVAAALLARQYPSAALPLATLLEITTGAQAIALLPLPLAWRTALLAGAAGFGGMAGVLQNRTYYPAGLLRMASQVGWQLVHGGVSFLLALGIMLLTG